MRTADGLTGILLAVAVWVVLSGGLRASSGSVTVSITSADRPALLALALAFIRHAVWRRPSLLDVVRRAAQFRMPAAWVETLPIWAVSRFSVIAAGYFAVLIIGFPERLPVVISENALLNLPARWDATWYLDIAERGYRWDGRPDRQQNVAFFPAVPLSMRIGGVLLGAEAPGVRRLASLQRMLIAGWLVALGTFWLALVYVHRWSDMRAGPSAARATTILLAAYPFAVFFSAPYTESLYLLASAAAFLHFERAEWFRSAGWGFLVGLVRPNGVLLTIPLAIAAVVRHGRDVPRVWPPAALWVPLAAPAVALFLHSLYLQQVTGQWFAWMEAQSAWGRTYDVGAWLDQAFSEIVTVGAVNYVEATPLTILNGLAAGLALALLWPVTTRVGVPYAAFVLVNLVSAIASGGLMSVGRLTSTMFPLFFALAVTVRERHLVGWIVGFSVLQGLLAALFFTWRQPV